MDAPNSKIWKHPYGRRRRGETNTENVRQVAFVDVMVSVMYSNCMSETFYQRTGPWFLFSRCNITTISEKSKELMIFLQQLFSFLKQSISFHLFSERFLYEIQNFFHFYNFTFQDDSDLRKTELAQNIEIHDI